MDVKIELFEVGAYWSDFFLWGWMKGEVYKQKVNTRDELVARIVNSAAFIKQESQDDLKKTTRTVLLPRGLKIALQLMKGFLNI